ncbi:hypothetical protein ACFLXB_02250 [Chloroflexota bacterium]
MISSSTKKHPVPFDRDRPMGQVRQLDQLMDVEGYLHLMVSEPLAINLSNTVDYLNTGDFKQHKMKRVSFMNSVVNFSPFRKLLWAVYDQIFRWFYA